MAPRPLLLAFAFALALLGVLIVVSGGLAWGAGTFRVSARSPWLALFGSAVAFASWWWLARRADRHDEDLHAVDVWLTHHSLHIGVIVAALGACTAWALGSAAATGSDPSGYLSQARMWADGRFAHQEPLAPLATWSGGTATVTPLGWVAASADLQLPTYAAGLALLLAPLDALGGGDLAIVLINFSFAVAVVAAAVLARRIGGAFAAIITAVWLTTSPVALVMSMFVMSDMPMTAAWLASWCLAFRGRAWGAGIGAALAVAIRPNLAPLAPLPALYLLFHAEAPPSRLARALRYSVPVALAATLIAFLHWRWFGSPLRSGYGVTANLFDVANVGHNIPLYGSWLLEVHGPWLLLAPLGLIWNAGRRDYAWLAGFAVLNVAAYLIFAQFEVWLYLRFVLPALAVAMIGVSSLIAPGLARVHQPGLRLLVLGGLVLAITAGNLHSARTHDVFRFGARQDRSRVVGEQLAPQLAPNAVIVSGEQSGAMRHYTNRSILRWDLMNEAAMGEALQTLTMRGYEVWVVLDDWEEEPFRKLLPSLASLSLDHPPALSSLPGLGIRTSAWRVERLTR